MTSLPNDVIQLDKIHRSQTDIIRMSTRRRASEESLKSVASVTVESVNSHNRMGSKRNFIIGLLLLFVVVVLWTASNFITQVRGRIRKTRSRLILSYRICLNKVSTSHSW
jgi:hypothetical protein